MILELHMIQNFAPSNLNRGDTGAPKDCIFGGSRRARISSQCFKRAMREHFKSNFESQSNLAERSIRLVDAVASRLSDGGKDKEEATRVVKMALSGIGLKMSSKDERKTQYLLFLGRDEINRFAEVCSNHYDALLAVAPVETGELTAKKAKAAAKDAVPAEISKELLRALDGGKAADLGLFGRMLADLPEKNRDASSQVAHAISTHKTGIEFDFFTAVDDLKPEDTAGSDHLGTVEFNSACFYRYSNVNVGKLRENLQGDDELTRATIEAYMKAAVEAIPTGKQNSFATHERPSLVFAVVRPAGMLSLANAFENAVKHEEWNDETKRTKEGLVANSISRMANHYAKVSGVYGDTAVSRLFVNTDGSDASQLGNQSASFSELIDGTIAAIFNKQEA